jgi:hypothetical protein
MNYFAEEPIDILKKAAVQAPPTDPPKPANLGVLHLRIATTIFEKIHLTASLAQRFVPTQHQYIESPPNKVTELSILFSCISEQLGPLKTHLMFAQLGGIPVSSELKYFHQIVDRLRLLSGPLSNDYHFLREPHARRSVPLKSLKFKRKALFDKTPNIKLRADQGGYQLDLEKYEKRATSCSAILKYLCGCLTGRLVSLLDSWSMTHNNELLESWLPKYSIEILVDRNRTTPNLSADFAVLMMAVHRFPQILANHTSSTPIPTGQTSANQKHTSPLPAREHALLKTLYRLADPSLSSQEINTSRSKVILEFFLQEQKSDSLDPDSSSPKITPAAREKTIQQLNGILMWRVGVFESWQKRQDDVTPEDFMFSEMVRLARAKMPFATCDEVLVLAQRIDRDWDRIITDDQPGEIGFDDLPLSVTCLEENGAMEVAMEETNQGLQTGVSRSPPRREKERPVEKDVLRKVRKTVDTKRNDIRGRLGPGVANSIYPEAKGKSKPRVVIQIE